eukprot:12237120-Alexandrium_andersonii.AAC.1
MSASLVGSEMCIRDSLLIIYVDDFKMAGPYFSMAAGRKLLRKGLPIEPCLLYTSDAADDM